jgi:glyoxylase-like metal-dependent hydrolase (beta-lactamase superfamily II)
VILFEPASRTLVSADALWERGFGVVFPELDGDDGFDEVAATLDVIESLKPTAVIPGHGAPFADVATALATARARLDGFVASPHKHRAYAAKVMLKFKLLEAQTMSRDQLLAWALGTDYLARLFAYQFEGQSLAQGLDALVQDLVRSGAATQQGTELHNA